MFISCFPDPSVNFASPMSHTSADRVFAALSTVEDPDLKRDLVTLGMVSNALVDGNRVSVKVTLTTPACPLREKIRTDCIDALRNEFGDGFTFEVVMDARVTSTREKENVLPGVKNVIAIASGKGGVGKSTVAVNLALALKECGSAVGILDADIYGPSLPIMLNIHDTKPEMTKIDGKTYMLPVERYGLRALSIGMLIDEKQPVVWRGPMASSALRQFITDCFWGELDYLIVDLPPGTGDIHLTLVGTAPITGAVIVTTPQDVALADAKKAIGMFTMQQVNVPILGVVENMAFFTPAELPNNKYFIFGKGGGEKLAAEFDTTLLGQVPLVQSIREGGDSGVPAMLDSDSPTTKAFEEIAANVARAVAVRNANFAVPATA
jgi:ATP-binding protein involved in chromosome partitioning